MNFLFQYKYWFLIGFFSFLTIFIFWQVSNFWGAKSRGRRRSSLPAKRKSDSIVLSPMEKKLLKEAHKLLQKGKIPSAARIFEQIGLHREAIQTLEEHGMIHEAAKILMRMGRHNRAGVIYARHGLWDFAAQSFKMANMPLEVAKCAKESGDIKTAAEYFELAERFEEAADILYQLGNLKKAGQLYLKSGNKNKSINVYNQIGSQKNLTEYQFSSEETTFVTECMLDKDIYSAKNIDGIAEIICYLNLEKQVIQKLIVLGAYRQAIILIKKQKFDLGMQLIAEMNFQGDQVPKYAQFFIEAELYNNAGIVYEKAQNFFKAAECFEKVSDVARAIYCYERAGMHEKARSLKLNAKGSPNSKNQSIKSPEPLFALSNSADSSLLDSKADLPEDSTQIVANLAHDSQKSKKPPAPSEPKQTTPQKLLKKESQNSFNSDSSTPRLEDSQSRIRFPLPIPEESNANKSGSLPPIPTSPSELNMLPSEISEMVKRKEIFSSIKFFADLDSEQIDVLWKLSENREIEDKKRILSYQDEPLGIYVILEGKVNCYRMVGGEEKFLDQMNPGESFGELWLLTDTPSTVNFVAASNVIIQIILRETFNKFLDSDGTVARKVYKRFTTRLLKRILTPSNYTEKKIAS